MTSRTVTDDAVRRTRVAAQLLHKPGPQRPAVVDVVARVLATQAQDVGAAPLAVRARSRGLTAADVGAAREDRSVVRAWGPRGTLHLVAAEDLGWLVPVVLSPLRATVARRLAQEGLPGPTARLLGVVERALSGQGPLTKQQLAARLAAIPLT